MKKYIIILVSALLSTSCSDFLDSDPYSFYAPDKTYVNTAGFNSALNGLHAYTRLEFNTWTAVTGAITHAACPYEILQVGTDICYVGMGDGTLTPFEDYSYSTATAYINNRWKYAFGMIGNANTMINSAENPGVAWSSPDDKNYYQANARFFRAYAYRCLVYLFGDVPWVTEVTNTQNVKADFERTPKAEIYKHIIEDLEFAAKYLPENPTSSTMKDGMLTKWAALHMLSEICNSAGEYKKAEESALAVINSGHYRLMTDRFGADLANEGDVFSDLFKDKNYNRGGGNMESIWVIQAENGIMGGSDKYTDWTRRAWVPGYDKIPGFLADIKYGGRGLGQIRQIDSWYKTFDAGDIRNSEYNVRTKYYYNNPASDKYGQLHTIVDQERNEGKLFEAITKFDYGVPDISGFEGNMKDKYRMRLAETYLLLAEAYINQGQTAKATDAINVVRARAKAIPATTAEVNMDYLLDERSRELIGEELRRYTLSRTGKFVDRVKKINLKSGSKVNENYVLWPIPQAVMNSNSDNPWTNNPGYN